MDNIQIKKIAILNSFDDISFLMIHELKRYLQEHHIESEFFTENDSIIAYQPDCVIVTSPQHAKLTPYPTYGLIDKACNIYLELPRFLRNILTYDGYLVGSTSQRQMLKDLMFGARKLDTELLSFSFYPGIKNKDIDKIKDEKKIILFEPDYKNSKFKNAITSILEHIPNTFVLTFKMPELTSHVDRFIVANDINDVDTILKDSKIGISLDTVTDENQISFVALKCISAFIPTIALHTNKIESVFQDSVYYISNQTSARDLPTIIKQQVLQIESNIALTENKCEEAIKFYYKHFTTQNFLQAFNVFHITTLINKGYRPHPDEIKEKSLPSVSYIVRTGGKHRHYLERSLSCLVAQQYPDIHVILCLYKKVPYLEEVIAAYPTLNFKVITNLGSSRSEAIRDGMAAVTTKLFGLFDEDDEMFPNHVRSLVKTLDYHQNRDWRGQIGMVYSGSIHVDDTHPVKEPNEFQDHKLINRGERRAVEHFRFYSSLLMSQHLWYMPNGWLARSELIDNEILEDPVLDTCEDLYFELQIAQKAHFAFSVEVTAVHHFHCFGNSTIEDSHKHRPDTARIALRNFSRVFPADSLYDCALTNIGRTYSVTYPAYVDTDFNIKSYNYYFNHAYFLRRTNNFAVQDINATESSKPQIYRAPITLTTVFVKWPIRALIKLHNFYHFDNHKKKYYVRKLKTKLSEEGYWLTLKHVFGFVKRKIV